jgi:hypothetical protein
MVASEMGKLQLAVLPLEKAEPVNAGNKRPGQLQNQKKGFDKIVYESNLKQQPAAESAGQTEISNGGLAENTAPAPVWSFKVSPALAKLIAIAAIPPPPSVPPSPSSTGSTLENLIRRPLVQTIDSPSAAPHPLAPKNGNRSPYYVEGRR